MIYLRSIGLSFFCAFGVLLHSASADDSFNPVGELFELSGMKIQMQQVSTAIAQGFDSSGIEEFTGKNLPQESLERIRRDMVSAFNPKRLSAVVMATLHEELTSSEVDTAIDWHRSVLGVKITGYETARSHLTQAADRRGFMQSLRNDPPTSERLSALKELNLAWRSTETSVSMMVDMQVAVSAAMMTALPYDQRTSISALIDIYEAQREALTVHYNSETIWSMLYVYSNLSIAEIRQYSEFARSQSGQQYVRATNMALHKAMLEGSYALGIKLGIELGSQPDSKKELSENTTM